MTGRAFDPGEPVAYPWAGEFLDAWVAARAHGDISSFIDLLAADATLVPGPFEAELEGTNAIRAYFLGRLAAETDIDLVVERHWVSGATILAAWHSSARRRTAGGLVRESGFLTAEIRARRCTRLRFWTVSAPGRE